MSRSKVFFEPFVGEKYGKSSSIFDKKLMVVGASHYCEHSCVKCGEKWIDDTCRTFTSDCVREGYLEGAWDGGNWRKTYTTFINSFYGRASSQRERELFFDSIVFYNFLQEREGVNPNDKHPELFNKQENVDAFCEIVKRYAPDIVITWGNKPWEAIPYNLGDGDAKPIKKNPSFLKYTLAGKNFILFGAHHPCAGFDSAAHHAIFNELGLSCK